MNLAPNTTLHGFTISAHEDLPEIDGSAYIGIHDASGARLLYLANDDEDKSFAIGFRTPPKDDTGVFHILEHSVLCGSRRFPVKEPFVDLLKGSMQTFLNAMTFDDKTLYPVASTNEQDLMNLMDVYLDAVFHPNIYEKRAIFEQEGWHYELHAKDGATGDPAKLPADQTTLVHNGVVFNEMKGSLSSSSAVLYDELETALLPDTCYAFESGGTPAAIPTLTYEDFLDEHRRHYRTDNSYIILYGNLDIDRVLAFIDERYLTPVAAEQAEVDAKRAEQGLPALRPRTIEMQAPVRAGYTRRTMDTAPENVCLASGYIAGTSSDRVRLMAIEALLDALFGSNEAPCKRYLLDAGAAHDVHAFLADALKQPFAVVEASMPGEGIGERWADLVAESVHAALEGGLDKTLVEAALSNAEFKAREHDMGTSDGVIYAMTALSGWLYDDDAPIDYLRYEEAFAELRKALEGDYYDRLCAELLLDNPHRATVEIVPTPGESDDDWPEKLAEMNRDLSADQRAEIVREEALLRELQEAPDTPEAIATLPRLAVSDIAEAPAEPPCELDEKTPLTCLRHSVSTHGIAYATRYFAMDRLAFDELPYAAVLAMMLGNLDTAHHTAAEIDTLTQGKLGNLLFHVNVFGEMKDAHATRPMFTVSASSLSANAGWMASLTREILVETDFSDKARILDRLKQGKIGLEQRFASAGHTSALMRLGSYYSPAGVLREQVGNVGFYWFICELLDDFENRADDLVNRLGDIACRLFCDDNCTVSFAGNDEAYAQYWDADPTCGRKRPAGATLAVPEPTVLNEAFIVPSDVCFAATGWDHRMLGGDAFLGSWLVAAKALSLDYLWNEVRVKGGAYGVGFQAKRQGVVRFYSYRDPHLDETIARFEKASDWLLAYEPSQDDLEGFIVSTVASLDAPVKPRALMQRQVADYFSGNSLEQRRETRRQVIATNLEMLRGLAPTVKRALSQQALCVFGSKEILEASKADLKLITLVG